jgi:iron complex outermembrane receptor protein
LKYLTEYLLLAVMLFVWSDSVLADHDHSGSATLEVVSVTATRLERNVKDVPESISVIGAERIDNARMFNIADAISGTPGVNITSKSGGYDTRLIIRGGGLKANYGIREIFLMRDGVPITDPDSFSKLDYIDTQDIARIEITKGPGNIYATGSTAGVVHIISRSVFDESASHVAVGGGDDGQENYNLRLAGQSGNQGYALTAAYRKHDNDWRLNNQFESSQLSFKYGQELHNDSQLLFEVGYTDANLGLAGDMTEQQYEQYLHSGKQEGTNNPFKHRGRFSETINTNVKYSTALDQHWQFNPRLYYTHWEQYHPVLPLITTAAGVDVVGTDLEFVRSQNFGSLVTGVTYRIEDSDGNKNYEYADVSTLPTGRIVSTNSDNKGRLAEQSDGENIAEGFFAQQSIDSLENWIFDISMRYDRISIDQDIERLREFNWAAGVYRDVDAADQLQRLDETFSLLSKRLGVSYSISEQWSVYANVAGGEQVPYSSELEDNPLLSESNVDSYEIGLKGRSARWEYDISLYSMAVEDEIISILDENGETEFQNAGKTDKLGFELASSVNLFESNNFGALVGGFNYTYSDYTFDDFQEIVTLYGPFGPASSEIDRSGNQLPFIPEHYYSVSLNYQPVSDVSIRVQADNWGEYYVDNANSEKDDGYEWLTSLNISYTFLHQHKLSLNLTNLTDKRYASVVTKDVGKDKAYTPGAPRSGLLTYRYSF